MTAHDSDRHGHPGSGRPGGRFSTPDLTRRQFIQSAALLGVSFSSMGAILAACGGETEESSSASPSPKNGGTLTFGLQRPGGQVDPLTTLDRGSFIAMYPVFRPLIRFGADGNLVPSLATSWEPNADATEWTFALRETTWSNGTPFGADDVVYSIKTLLGPDSKSASVGTFFGILAYDQAEKVDDHTVKFHLERPYVDFPYICNHALWVLPNGYTEGDFAAGKVAIGPLQLESITIDRGAVYKKNPNYWAADTVHIDGAEAKFYDDAQATVIGLQGGEIAVAPEITTDSIAALRGNDAFTIHSTASSEYTPAALRTDQKPFDDVRVRQALAYALDRAGINDTLYAGTAALGNDHAFAPNIALSKEVLAQVPQRERDVEKAKALLAEAGYADGLEVKLTIPRAGSIPQFATLIQANARDAGVTVEIEQLTEGAFYGTPGNEPWLTVPFGITPWAARFTATATIGPAYTKEAAWNSAHWINEEFSTLITQIDAETDEQKRSELAVQAAKIQHEEVPALIAFWIPASRALSTSVHGLKTAVNVCLDVEDVWLG